MPGYEVHHVHLYSPDPIKTADFYEKFFGATRRRPDREVDEGSLEDGPPFYAVQLVLNGVGIFVRSQKEGATIPSEPVRGHRSKSRAMNSRTSSGVCNRSKSSFKIILQ